MASKTINISLDEKLLKEIDKAAKAEFSSRSDYIRASVVEKINASKGGHKIDEDYDRFVAKYRQTLKNLANR